MCLKGEGIFVDIGILFENEENDTKIYLFKSCKRRDNYMKRNLLN